MDRTSPSMRHHAYSPLHLTENYFLSKTAINTLISHAEDGLYDRGELKVIFKSREMLALHLTSWGADGLGIPLFEELYESGFYRHNTVFGIDLYTDESLLPGDMYLYHQKHDVETCLGSIRTQMSDNPNVHSHHSNDTKRGAEEDSSSPDDTDVKESVKDSAGDEERHRSMTNPEMIEYLKSAEGRAAFKEYQYICIQMFLQAGFSIEHIISMFAAAVYGEAKDLESALYTVQSMIQAEQAIRASGEKNWGKLLDGALLIGNKIQENAKSIQDRRVNED